MRNKSVWVFRAAAVILILGLVLVILRAKELLFT
jgi:hypothetical protein